MKIAQRRRPRFQALGVHFLLGVAGLAVITFICFKLGFGLERTGFVYLVLIALLSVLGGFTASVISSLVAAACLNYFFAPPLFAFRIDVPDDKSYPLRNRLVGATLDLKGRWLKREAPRRTMRRQLSSISASFDTGANAAVLG